VGRWEEVGIVAGGGAEGSAVFFFELGAFRSVLVCDFGPRASLKTIYL